MICGDTNVDLLKEDINSDVFNSLYSLNYFPLINIATRVTDQSATCIDHIWFNRFNVLVSGSIISDVSDHYPIFCVLNKIKRNESFVKTFRIHSERAIISLCTDITIMCDNYFNQCSNMDVDNRCKWFTDEMFKLNNRNCPKKSKTVSVKSLLKPWISDEIKQMANYKHKLFKQYKQNTIPFEVYNVYKNNLNSKIRLAKRKFYFDKFKACSGNIKETWRIVNKILRKPKNKPSLITLTDSCGNIVDDRQKISNMFCDHFSSIANKLDSQIPYSNKNPVDYLPEPNNVTFDPSPATPKEVENLIMSLKNKQCYIDSIPIFIYKKLARIIAPIIVDIFNCSISEGNFPNILKTARVIPLFKSKNSQLTENFRPISLLPLMSKILEKLLKTRTNQFLEENNILYNNQFGFRNGYNTSDALLHYVDDCVSALDERLYTVSVFLDFSKAFDTINRHNLLSKLDRLGFRGNVNNLLKSYLSDRRMFVHVNGCKSDCKTVNIGVPQGSVSAAWLFSLYINDMHRSSKKLKFIHFADDTTVYRSGCNLSELCNDVCLGLNDIDEWLKVNRLSLNVDKTYFMIHTHCNFNVDECKIEMRGKRLNYVKCTKFLGLILMII